MKTWKIILISLSCILILAVLSVVSAKYAYVARYNRNKKELDFSCVDTQTDKGELKVMSANLRCDALFDFGKKSWQYRAELIAKNIEQVKPTVIGMQEATQWQYDYYKDTLKNYDSVLTLRDATSNAEGCPIFYRTDLYSLIDKGAFWLSETPDVMSKDWGSACYRICSYVILQDKATERKFVVFNTHLDHVSEEARQKGIDVVLGKIKDFGGYPAILMGDFNAEYGTETYNKATAVFDDAKFLVANDVREHCTYQNWGAELNYPPIDYFMISQAGFAVNSYEVVDTTYDGVYPSDHFPIVIRVLLI